MKKILLILALLFAPSLAWGQCSGVYIPGTVCGNAGASNAPPAMTPIGNFPSSGLTITRLQIPTKRNLPATFAVGGYRTANDLGQGCVYSSVGSTSNGIGAIQSADSVWFNLSFPNDSVNVGCFGPYADASAGLPAQHPISSGDIAANPWWRGTYSAGVTSWDTVANQEAIYAAYASRSTPGVVIWNTAATPSAVPSQNRPLYVPTGSYYINQQIVLVATGIDMTFATRRSTLWFWYGSPSVSMFLTDSASYGVFNNIGLRGSQVFGGVTLWTMDHTGANPGIATQQLTINNLFAQLSPGGGPAVWVGGASNAQGDTVAFNNPFIQGSNSQQCVLITGANALNILFNGGNIQNCPSDGIAIIGGSVDVYGTSFQGESFGGTGVFSPQINQVTTAGADIHIYGGNGASVISKVQDVRSESDIGVVVNSSGGVVVDNYVLASASFLPWFASFPYQLGTLSGPTSAGFGAAFIVVGNSGMNQWKPMSQTGSVTVVTDPTASYTVNQWAGYVLYFRYDNGFTENHLIASNTATTITLVDPLGQAPSAVNLYTISGTSSASEPAFSTAPTTFKSLNNFGVGQNFATTSGSTSVVYGSSMGGRPPNIGEYVIIPGAGQLVQPSPPVTTAAAFRSALIARITNIVSQTLTLDTAASVTNTSAFGYYGPGFVDNQLTWMRLSLSAFENVTSLTNSNAGRGDVLTNGPLVHYFSQSPAVWRNYRSVIASQFSYQMYFSYFNEPIINGMAAAISDASTPVDLTAATYASNVIPYTPTKSATLNAPLPSLSTSQDLYLQITTTGTTSWTTTFGTNFNSAGTFSTGVVSGVKYTIHFRSDGVTWNEVSRGATSPIPGNTMIGNWTGALAAPVANAMPSCSDAGGAHLNYVSGTGIACGSSGVTLIAYNNTESVVHTGDTSPVTFYTIAVPGNTMGANGALRITILYRYTGTAGTKTGTVTFGGSTFYNTPDGTTILSHRIQTDITNRNATNSQVGAATIATNGGWGAGTVDIATGAVDTTTSQNIVIGGQLSNAGDSIAVEMYRVELIKP